MADITSAPLLHQQPLDQVGGSVALETSSQASSIGSVMDGALSSDGAVPVMHDEEEETTRGGQVKQRGRPSKGDDSVQSLNCRWEGCGESFPSAKEARAHERVHGNGPDVNGLFVCKMNGCGRDFRASRQLRKHLILHQPKSMVCRVCNKAFHDVGKLARHEKVHTGAKPFTCPECGKEFGLRANLKTHMRVHSGERPFSCPVEGCDKKFAQACNRNTHLQTHYKKEAFEMQAGSAAASLMYMPLGSTSTSAIFPGFSNITAPHSSSNSSSNNNTAMSYPTSSSGGNHVPGTSSTTSGNQGTTSSSLFSGWTSGNVSFSVGTPQPSWVGHSSPQHTWGGVSSSSNNVTSTTSTSASTTTGTTAANASSSSFFPADIVSWANFEQPIPSSSNTSLNANTASGTTGITMSHHHHQHHRTGSNGVISTVSSSSPMGLLDQNINHVSFDLNNTTSLLGGSNSGGGGGGSASNNNNGKPVTHVEDASLLLYLQGRANN